MGDKGMADKGMIDNAMAKWNDGQGNSGETARRKMKLGISPMTMQ